MAILTATTTTLLPPLSVKPSLSMPAEDSVFDKLGATALPDKEINAILNLHESLSLDQLTSDFDRCMDKMARWLETAQLAVFTLEMNLKQDIVQIEETQSMLALAFGRMEPLISILAEVEPIMEDKLDEDDGSFDTTTKKMQTRMAITKIQSEWSGLQHFLTSVLKQLDSMNEKKELTYLMENVLRQIDDLSIRMFQFQERRHATAAIIDTASEAMSSPLSSVSSCFSPSTTTTTNTTNTAYTFINNNEPQMKDEHVLAEIDGKVEPLFNDVQKIYASMTSPSPPEDPSGMLSRKHHMVQHRWEALRVEIDDLKEELKEDRWLTVFRQVADQVDVMIDGLDKTVQQCYTIIQQTHEWHAAQPTSALDKLSKTLMRSLPRNGHAPLAVDRDKFRSVEKNFEAKDKYYTPSIGKMLGMLGSGIVSRVARDNVTSKRHASMTQRWNTLKLQMDNLRTKDLPETARLLEPNKAPPLTGWKGIRYKSPEPPGEGARAKKLANSLPKTNHSAVPRRQNNDDDEFRRVRSVTPSGDLRSRMYSPVPKVPQQPRAASSLAYTRESLRPSASESSSIDSVISHMRKPASHESKSLGVQEFRRKSRVPKTDDVEASWMKPTKSTLMRNRRTQSVDNDAEVNKRPKTPVRSKTPTAGHYSRKSATPVPLPSRPKSSMGSSRPSERAVSPIRRTMTPSLIPRPKTPSSSMLRCASPSLIPRPRSSMHHYHHNDSFLSVPPDHSPPSSPHVRKKHSMPALMHRTASPFRMTHVPNTRAASPPYRRQRQFSEEDSFQMPQREVYTANPRDALDVEVARIVNGSPITVKCQKGPLGGGRYYFGNELNPSVGGGKKLYTCKLMNYANRDNRRSKAPQNKVLVRVGGGWQDLEMFLLDHSNLMTATSDVVSRRLFK